MDRFKLNTELALMEPNENGFFIRYDDILPIIKAIQSGYTDDYGDLIIPVEKVQTLLNFAQVKR